MQIDKDTMIDLRNMLGNATFEIRQLRQANAVLQAKSDTMDLFALVLRTQPNYQSQGRGVDVAWEMDRMREKLDSVKSADK
jgi:hypothetical protein